MDPILYSSREGSGRESGPNISVRSLVMLLSRKVDNGSVNMFGQCNG